MNCPTDIILVLDASDSVGSGNFSLLKSFVSEFVRGLDIDGGNTRIGIIIYGSSVAESFSLNEYSSIFSILSAILSLSYAGGTTNTAVAFEFVRTTMLTSAAGDRSNVSNVVIHVTAGQSDDASLTAVSVSSRLYTKTACSNSNNNSNNNNNNNYYYYYY